LQAGARIAEQSGGAFAIVWGAPTSTGVRVWTEERVPRSYDRRGRASTGVSNAGRRRLNGDTAHARQLRPSGTPFPYLLEGVAVREQDFTKFIRVINKRANHSALSQKALTSEIQQSWRAVPILAPRIGSFGFYRIEEGIPGANRPRL
jgi:hypothetical protein